jgi:hypothetical protein
VLVVWIVLAVVAVVVLASVTVTVLGAVSRLRREVAALGEQVRPVLTEVQATLDRAARQRSAEG